MRIVFMGTMDFAVPILFGLVDKYQVELVVTQPDKPSGRGKKIKQSSVKVVASSLGIPVFQPVSIKKDYQQISDINPDLLIVCAYGQMIPKELLDLPKYKAINVHASLLPKYRGGSPMQRAIMADDQVTGVTVMYMAPKMDSGPILAQAKLPILPDDNVGSLEGKLAVLGRNLLLETLPKLLEGKIEPISQNEAEVTYAYNLKPEEEKLDFNTDAKTLFNKVRALYPKPIAYTMIDGLKLKVLTTEVVIDQEDGNTVPGEIIKADKSGVYVGTQKGILSLLKIQLEGRNAMDVQAFMNGIGRSLLVKGRKFK
jgi:methionyl-tRNA formyltransferase